MKYTIVDGHHRALGCLPRVTTFGDGTFKPMEDDWVIPQGEWSQYPDGLYNLRRLVWHVIDQKSQGSCCGCMVAQSGMMVREFMGLKRIALSQAVPYSLGNGGSDSGMAIDTGLGHLLETGLCSVDVVGPYDWQGRRRGNWPDNWREECARIKGYEWRDVPPNGKYSPYEYLISGVKRGWPACFGAKGHAVIQADLNNVIGSWGEDYGDNGFHHWATEREINSAVPGYGGWVLCAVTDPSNDVDV